MKLKIIVALLAIILGSYNLSFAATELKNEGVSQGYINRIDCTGAGIDCTRSGITGTLAVTGGGGSISNDAYGVSWSTDETGGASRKALYNKIETLGGGHDAVTLDANVDNILTLSTQELGLVTQVMNTVFSGPASGVATVPSFRALVSNDIPDLSAIYWTTSAGKTWAGNDIALTTNTSGNYVASVATTSPLAGGAAGSEGATLTLSIPKADDTTNGYLWSTDRVTFNGKMDGTLAKDLVTTSPLSGGTDNILPGADADITIAISKADTTTNGYLWSTDWNTFNDKMAGTLAKDLVTTSPLAGGTDNILPGADADITLSISKADATTNGYLWSTDWVTFNGKMAGTLTGDLVTTAPITGGVNDIFPGDGTKATIALTVLKDIVAGVGLSGGENDVLPGADADTTLTVDTTELEGLTWGAGGNASNVWTFNLSGTDWTIGIGSNLMTVSPLTSRGTITSSGTFDVTGAVGLVLGSADVTGCTITTDGTGNGELTLPADSLGIADIDWGTGAGQVPLSKSFQLSGTIATSSDYGTLWKTPVAITITSVNVTATGGTSWSIVGHLDECDANGANCAGVDGATDITCTSGTNAADDGTLSNPSIDANDWVGWHTTATTWTTGGVVGITFNYTE